MLLVAGLLFNASIHCQDKENASQLSKKHAVGFVINTILCALAIPGTLYYLIRDTSNLSKEDQQWGSNILTSSVAGIPLGFFNTYLCWNAMWIKTDREQPQQEKGHA